MISNALLTNPHQVSGLLSLVFGTKDDGVSTAIDLITGGLGKTMIIDNREYEWSVMIDQDHAVNIVWAKCDGNIITSATEAPGINRSPIYIALGTVLVQSSHLMILISRFAYLVLRIRMVMLGYMSAM